MAERIDGLLYWEQLGRTGRPLVFLHPIHLDHSAWVYQMAHLSTWFRCIGIDAPGYGRSPTAHRGLTMMDIAQACWEAIDEITDEAPNLLGCSLGSALTWHMANQLAVRFARLEGLGCRSDPRCAPC